MDQAFARLSVGAKTKPSTNSCAQAQYWQQSDFVIYMDNIYILNINIHLISFIVVIDSSCMRCTGWRHPTFGTGLSSPPSPRRPHHFRAPRHLSSTTPGRGRQSPGQCGCCYSTYIQVRICYFSDSLLQAPLLAESPDAAAIACLVLLKS